MPSACKQYWENITSPFKLDNIPKLSVFWYLKINYYSLVLTVFFKFEWLKFLGFTAAGVVIWETTLFIVLTSSFVCVISIHPFHYNKDEVDVTCKRVVFKPPAAVYPGKKVQQKITMISSLTSVLPGLHHCFRYCRHSFRLIEYYVTVTFHINRVLCMQCIIIIIMITKYHPSCGRFFKLNEKKKSCSLSCILIALA